MFNKSRINLLGKRIQSLDHLQRKKGFIDMQFFRKRFFELDEVVMELSIPHYDLVRGELFCDDLIEEAGGEVGDFTIDHLLSMLFEDFLRQIRNKENDEMYSMLMQLKEKHSTQKTVSRLQQKSANQWERIKEIIPKQMQTITYRIHMNRKSALRIEVLLSDISNDYPDLTLTVEVVLSLLYMDFIASIKKGNTPQVIQRILSR